MGAHELLSKRMKKTPAIALAVLAALVLADAPRAPAHGEAGLIAQPAGPPAARMDGVVSAAAAGIGSPEQLRVAGLRPHDGVVTVELTGGSATAATIRALGGKVLSAGGGAVEARIPAGRLYELAATPGVGRLSTPDAGVPETVTGGEVAASGAAQAQAAGVTGEGVRIMVLDSEFAELGTAQAAGELPAAAQLNFCSSFAGGGNHGTEVAEIVHDMAPSAQLYLVCADSTADLFEAVAYAEANGIRIISRSVGSFNSGRGDGTGAAGSPDAAVAEAVSHGILWVNSAGNYARSHWGGAWSPSSDATTAGSLDWGGGDTTNAVTIAQDTTQCIYLKWDDWPVSDVDLALVLRESGASSDILASDDPQTGSQPPIEHLCVTNPGPTRSFDILVRRSPPSGPVPRVDLFVPEAGRIEHSVAATSLNDLAGNPNVLSTTAVCAGTGAIQTYSSQGPSIGGLVKPDMAALTPVSTSTEAASGCATGFSGTSATAPQIAGAAALFSQALGLQGTQARAPLESLASSNDLGAPGRDVIYGAGLLHVELVCGPRAVTMLGTPGNDAIHGTRGRDVIQGLGGDDRISGGRAGDRICGGPGKDRLGGGPGKDRLLGGPGKDRLRGGKGKDVLKGGSGKDNERQ
jgi:Ca2+-binding RTX toxin-like protein